MTSPTDAPTANPVSPFVRRYSAIGGVAHYTIAAVTRGAHADRALCGIMCAYGTAMPWQATYAAELTLCATCARIGPNIAGRFT